MPFNKFILLFLFTLLFTNGLQSQNDGEALDNVYATIRIIRSNEDNSNPRDLIFSIGLERKSEDWERYVNGTFIITFDTTGERRNVPDINAGTIEINRINETDLPTIASIGNQLEPRHYVFRQEILPGKICISVNGPEDFEDSKEVGLDSLIILGKYKLTSLNGAILQNQNLDFHRPIEYYNACAFKLKEDSTVVNVPQYYSANDNLEFIDPPNRPLLDFFKDTTDPEGFLLRSMRASYIGNATNRVDFETARELFTRGFAILRTEIPTYGDFEPDFMFADTVANFDWGEGYEFLEGLGTSRRSNRLYTLLDSINIRRNFRYCYKLLWIDFEGNYYNGDDPNDGLYERNIACAEIPNAVITYANNYPNPFQRNTSVEYVVDDDVYMTTIVYDMDGKEVDVIMSDQPVLRGAHVFELKMPELATNGLYNLIFIAKPINDITVELSRASLKLQMSR